MNVNIGDKVTWATTNNGHGKRTLSWYLTTGFLTGRVVNSNTDAITVQVICYSGDVPENAPETLTVSRSELATARADEWQHTTRVTPLDLAKKRHQRALAEATKAERRMVRALRKQLHAERERFERLVQMVSEGKWLGLRPSDLSN